MRAPPYQIDRIESNADGDSQQNGKIQPGQCDWPPDLARK